MTTMARWARWTPLTGAVSVVLWFLWIFALDADRGEDSAEIVSFYADEGSRDEVTRGAIVGILAIVFFAWFVAALRTRLERDGAATRLGSVALVAGTATAILWGVAIAAWTAMAFAVDDFADNGFVVDPHTERIFEAFGYLAFIVAGLFALVSVAAASTLALKTGTLPKWLAWIGFVVAALLVFTFMFIPFLVLLAWVLLVSLVLLFWKPAEAASTAAG